MLQRETKAIGRFILAYILLHVAIYIVFTYVPQILGRISSFSAGVTELVFLFVLQEMILLWVLSYIWMRTTWDWYRRQIHRLRKRRKWKWWVFVRKYVVWCFFLYFFLSGVLVWILTYMNRDIPWLYGEQLVMNVLTWISMTHWWEYAAIAIMVAILGPFVEEIIFRWAMTHSFMRERWRKWVVLAALVFAAIHAERAVVWNLVILSLFLWYIYRKTESMWYSFLFHVVINGLAISVLIITDLYPELIPAFLL
jgi:membrane protease YdiL (CAAX protease family)